MFQLHFFLQLGFVIGIPHRQALVQNGQHPVQNEPLRHVHSSVQEHGRNHRFHCVGQNGRTGPTAGAFLAPTQTDIIAQFQILRHFVQRVFAHQFRTELSHAAFGHFRIMGVEIFCRDKAQHGISQKLQPFIAGNCRVPALIGIRAVTQGIFQQSAVTERIIQLLFQCNHTQPST